MSTQIDLFQQAMNQGHSAAWDQMWDRAAGFYRQALEIQPDHPRALANLALALFELQDYDGSLQVYLKNAQVASEDPLPLEKVAQLYERLGYIDRAVAAALQAAELYFKNHELDQAITSWNRVLRLSPANLQAHARLALVYERLGKAKQAVAEYVNVASLFQRSNEFEKAAQTMHHALQKFPDSSAAQQALDMLRQGRLLPAPARPPGGTAPIRMAQVRQLDGSTNEDLLEDGLDPVAETRQKALTILAGMLFDAPEEDTQEAAPRRGLQAVLRGAGARLPKQADPKNILVHLSQVVDLQIQGQNDQAADELERAMEAGLDHPAAAFDLGLLRLESERLEESLQLLPRAVKDPDFSLGGHLLLGKALLKMDQPREAAIEYLKALSLADAAVVAPEQAGELRQQYEPIIEVESQQTDTEDHKRLCNNIAELLVQPAWRERLAGARQQLPIQTVEGRPVAFAEILTQSRSGRVVESLSLVNQLANAGYLQSAMEEAFYALEQAPAYLPLHVYMGELLLKQNQLPEAIAKLEVVARTYSIRGETGRAVELYRRVIALAPMDLAARTRLIDQLIATGQVEDALQEYLDFAGVYYDLAELELARKALAESLRLAQQSRVDRSWRVRILHRMADIDLQSLDWRQALRVFDQIRTLQPEEEKARLKLVELNFRLGQETQALAELDSYLDLLGNAGQPELAIAFLEDMLHENLDRPIIRFRLADLYSQVGRPGMAIAQLDAAGEASLQAGDQAGAIQAVEAILALRPSNMEEYQRLLIQLKS